MYQKYQNDLVANTSKNDDFFDTIGSMDTDNKLDDTEQRSSSNDFFSQFNDDGENEEERAVLGRNRRNRRVVSSTNTTVSNNDSTKNPFIKDTTNRSKFSSKKEVPHSEDLINIGAYKSGSNPEIDYAVRKIKEVNSFLCQGTDVGTVSGIL